MLRRNGEDRVPDRVLVAADLDGDSEELLKWTISRSQAGDILFLLHVIGPSLYSEDDDSHEALATRQAEGEKLRERIQALALLLGHLKALCEDLKVMTSMRVVRRQGLAPAIVKEASAIKATRVVVGSAGWFVQQRSRDLVGNWTVMLAFIETRLPSECLIMMVDDGRLAAVKRGKASGANGAQEPKAHSRVPLSILGMRSPQVPAQKLLSQDRGGVPRLGPKAPRMDPSIILAAPDDDMASFHCGGPMLDRPLRAPKRSLSAGKERPSPQANRRYSSPPQRPLQEPSRRGSPLGKLSPSRWGSPRRSGSGGVLDDKENADRLYPGFVSLFRGPQQRRKGSPSHGSRILDRLRGASPSKRGSPGSFASPGHTQNAMSGVAPGSPGQGNPVDGSRSPDHRRPSGEWAARSQSPEPWSSPSRVPRRFSSPRRSLRMDPLSLKLRAAAEGAAAGQANEGSAPSAGRPGSPGRGLVLSPFALRLSPDRRSPDSAAADRPQYSGSPRRRSPGVGAVARGESPEDFVRAEDPQAESRLQGARMEGLRVDQYGRAGHAQDNGAWAQQATWNSEAGEVVVGEEVSGAPGAGLDAIKLDFGPEPGVVEDGGREKGHEARDAPETRSSPSLQQRNGASSSGLSPLKRLGLATWGFKVKSSQSPDLVPGEEPPSHGVPAGDHPMHGMPGEDPPQHGVPQDLVRPEGTQAPIENTHSHEEQRGMERFGEEAEGVEEEGMDPGSPVRRELESPEEQGRPMGVHPTDYGLNTGPGEYSVESPGADDAETSAHAVPHYVDGSQVSVAEMAGAEGTEREAPWNPRHAAQGPEIVPEIVPEAVLAPEEAEPAQHEPFPEPYGASGDGQVGETREGKGGEEWDAGPPEGQLSRAASAQEGQEQDLQQAEQQAEPSPETAAGGCPKLPRMHQRGLKERPENTLKSSTRVSPLRRPLFNFSGGSRSGGRAPASPTAAAVATPSPSKAAAGASASRARGLMGRRRPPSPDRRSPVAGPEVSGWGSIPGEEPELRSRRRGGSVLQTIARAVSPSQRRRETAPGDSVGLSSRQVHDSPSRLPGPARQRLFPGREARRGRQGPQGLMQENSTVSDTGPGAEVLQGSPEQEASMLPADELFEAAATPERQGPRQDTSTVAGTVTGTVTQASTGTLGDWPTEAEAQGGEGIERTSSVDRGGDLAGPGTPKAPRSVGSKGGGSSDRKSRRPFSLFAASPGKLASALRASVVLAERPGAVPPHEGSGSADGLAMVQEGSRIDGQDLQDPTLGDMAHGALGVPETIAEESLEGAQSARPVAGEGEGREAVAGPGRGSLLGILGWGAKDRGAGSKWGRGGSATAPAPAPAPPQAAAEVYREQASFGPHDSPGDVVHGQGEPVLGAGGSNRTHPPLPEDDTSGYASGSPMEYEAPVEGQHAHEHGRGVYVAPTAYQGRPLEEHPGGAGLPRDGTAPFEVQPEMGPQEEEGTGAVDGQYAPGEHEVYEHGDYEREQHQGSGQRGEEWQGEQNVERENGYHREENEGEVEEYEQQQGEEYEQEQGGQYAEEQGGQYEQEQEQGGEHGQGQGGGYEQEQGGQYEQEQGGEYEQEQGGQYEQEQGGQYEPEQVLQRRDENMVGGQGARSPGPNLVYPGVTQWGGSEYDSGSGHSPLQENENENGYGGPNRSPTPSQQSKQGGSELSPGFGISEDRKGWVRNPLLEGLKKKVRAKHLGPPSAGARTEQTSEQAPASRNWDGNGTVRATQSSVAVPLSGVPAPSGTGTEQRRARKRWGVQSYDSHEPVPPLGEAHQGQRELGMGVGQSVAGAGAGSENQAPHLALHENKGENGWEGQAGSQVEQESALLGRAGGLGSTGGVPQNEAYAEVSEARAQLGESHAPPLGNGAAVAVTSHIPFGAEGKEGEDTMGLSHFLEDPNKAPIARISTVPQSFLWGECQVSSPDWFDWQSQRMAPRSISSTLSDYGGTSSGFVEAGGMEKDIPPAPAAWGYAGGAMGAYQDAASSLGVGPGGGGEGSKQPMTFVRPFSSARRNPRGVRGAPAGHRGSPRPVLNKVTSPSTAPLRTSVSEGNSGDAQPEGVPRGRPGGVGMAHEVSTTSTPTTSHGAGVAQAYQSPTVRSAPQSPAQQDADEVPEPMSAPARKHQSRIGNPKGGWGPSAAAGVNSAAASTATSSTMSTTYGSDSAGARNAAGAAEWAKAGGEAGAGAAGAAAAGWVPVMQQDGKWQSPLAPGSAAPPNSGPSLSPPDLAGSRSIAGVAGTLGIAEHATPPAASNAVQASPVATPAERGSGSNPLLVYPFSRDQLAQATNNFSPSLRLSRKPTFSVYWGQLQDGTGRLVTVKVPSVEGDEGAEARLFQEAKALSKVRHRNLVELLGVCSSGGGSGKGLGESGLAIEGERARRGVKGDVPRAQALVYEFVDGISLQDALQPESEVVLPWHLRHTVALDVAQAIMHLHTGLPELTAHGNVASSSVTLLRDSATAKLGGFNVTAVSSHKGRPGAQNASAAEDDVIAFGFLLLELICGQRRHGVRVVLPMLWEGRAEEIADPLVREGSGTDIHFHRLAYAAVMCLDSQQDGSIASINKVVLALSTDLPPWLNQLQLNSFGANPSFAPLHQGAPPSSPPGVPGAYHPSPHGSPAHGLAWGQGPAGSRTDSRHLDPAGSGSHPGSPHLGPAGSGSHPGSPHLDPAEAFEGLRGGGAAFTAEMGRQTSLAGGGASFPGLWGLEHSMGGASVAHRSNSYGAGYDCPMGMAPGAELGGGSPSLWPQNQTGPQSQLPGQLMQNPHHQRQQYNQQHHYSQLHTSEPSVLQQQQQQLLRQLSQLLPQSHQQQHQQQQIDSLQRQWSQGSGVHPEALSRHSTPDRAGGMLTETMSAHSMAHARSEGGRSESGSGVGAQSEASMSSAYLRKLEELQQQQEQMVMILMQQQQQPLAPHALASPMHPQAHHGQPQTMHVQVNGQPGSHVGAFQAPPSGTAGAMGPSLGQWGASGGSYAESFSSYHSAARTPPVPQRPPETGLPRQARSNLETTGSWVVGGGRTGLPTGLGGDVGGGVGKGGEEGRGVEGGHQDSAPLGLGKGKGDDDSVSTCSVHCSSDSEDA